MLDEANLKNNSEAYRSFVEFETIWHRQLIGGVSLTRHRHMWIYSIQSFYYIKLLLLLSACLCRFL